MRRRLSLSYCYLAATLVHTVLASSSPAGSQLAFSPPSSSSSVFDEIIEHYTLNSPEEARLMAADIYDEDIWSRKGNRLVVRRKSSPRVWSVSPDRSYMYEQLVESAPTISTCYNLDHSRAAFANFSSLPRSQRYDETSPDTDPIHLSYHPYEMVTRILHAFADDNPEWAEVVSFGLTAEGREILGLRVGNLTRVVDPQEEQEERRSWYEVWKKKKGKKGKNKKGKGKSKDLGMVIIGTQHAREWIAASTSLYFLHRLLSPPSPLLSELTLTVIPIVNVDGYVYTWESDRLWRKNRQPVGNDCFGIDLNRNWGYKWSKGARPNPCSDSYPGDERFQAVELQAVSNYMLNSSNHVASYVDLHSFGQMLMYPFSYSCDKLASDAEDQFEAVIGAAKALRAVHGRVFETGSVCSVSLSGPGDSIDWAYGKANIKWSFTFELRDVGVFGFLLPPNQIVPSGQETSAALLSLARFVVEKENGKKFVGY